jgi:tetratricopeptide (TPR) repeat protein
MKRILYVLVVLVLISCDVKENGLVTNPDDYNAYLVTAPTIDNSKYFELWNSKIDLDSTQLLSFGNVASEYHRFFSATGNISYLKKAEQALKKAVEIANINKGSYARALARNFISQHRFKDALEMVELAHNSGGAKENTQALFFDVHMELGHYELAQSYLDSIKNPSNFGYLIRAAKWNDYEGDLETTIHLMEKAMVKAESSKNRNLLLWSYTNIADYYGHAGRIGDSYSYYLKALKLDPRNAYALKGIAWVVYSHEKNGKEALRILDAIATNHHSPDYFLLKAELYDFMGNTKEKVKNMDGYFTSVENPQYGAMYNAFTIDFLLEHTNQGEKALKLALEEIENRATPESYNLLAKTYLSLGKEKEALKVIEQNVIGKTHEPGILLNAAAVYKANQRYDKVKNLKQELAEASYELGPITTKVIASL